MERKSSGKRYSFLARTKDKKENTKLSAKVCFQKYIYWNFKSCWLAFGHRPSYLEERAVEDQITFWVCGIMLNTGLTEPVVISS